MGVFRVAVIGLTLGFTLGIISLAKAGPQSQAGNQGGYNTQPVVSSPNSPDSSGPNAGQVPAPPSAAGTGSATTGANNSGSNSGSNSAANSNQTYDGTDDPDDPSLYRTRTQNALASGAMSRDEGQLTAKPRRREKITVVDSTKKLPTSGTDPKFSGSLLHSSVTSIDDISDKTSEAADDDQQDAQQGDIDPRFAKRRLVFKPQATTDDSKKKESQPEKADSPSPTPTPSPASSSSRDH